MVNKSKIKVSLLRVLIVTGLMLTAIFPGSAQALTQDLSTDAKTAYRGGASAGISKVGQTAGQFAPLAGSLPSGTSFLPSLLVNTIDTSTWDHPSTDPAGIAYQASTGKLLISDIDIEEAPQPFWEGFNVFQSTLTGTISSNCTTFTSSSQNPNSYNNFSDEPSGITINNSNNHIFFSDDNTNRIFEVAPGLDGAYCTSDDIVTYVPIGVPPFNVTDSEDLAYGQNKLYLTSGGDGSKTIYEYNLGVNGVLGGGDDSSGTLPNFSTSALGFGDVEGIAYNSTAGTLYILSTHSTDTYLGETTTGGTLLRAYDLSYLGNVRRSGLTVAPASGNPSTDNIYIVSRGADNGSTSEFNDGKIWEIDVTDPVMPDLIFKDGFESNNFSAWNLAATNNGNLNVNASAALFDNYGMRAQINSTTSMDVTDEKPTLEPRYRARFYFDPNSIGMASGDIHTIFQGYKYSPYFTEAAIPYTGAFRVDFRYFGGSYLVRGVILNDSAITTNGSFFPITDGANFIEVDWSAASSSGANNGYLTLWIDGVQVQTLTGIDNDTHHVDRVRLGPGSGLDSGTTGIYYFDAFESRRQNYIGPIIAPTVVSVVRADANPTNAATVDYTVTFSESVTGVDTADFSLTTTGVLGTSVNGVNGSGTTYTVTVNTGSGDGTIRLDVLDNNSIIDIDSNSLPNGYTSGEVYTIETDEPWVISVTRANSDPTNAANVDFNVTFSEAVTGVDLSDFTLTSTGVSGTAITGVSSGEAAYVVTVNTGTGDGTIRLDVLDDNSIVNTIGNSLDGGFTTGEEYNVDKTFSTTLTSIGAHDGWILESSETSGSGGTMNNNEITFNLGDSASRNQYRSILSFNTSSLPDNAIITKVTLKVKKHSIIGGGNPVSLFQGFRVDIKTGIFGTGALELGDFKTAASRTLGPFSPTLSGGRYSLNLTNGLASINKVGHTQLRLRFTLDDNNNNLANILKLFSGNATVVSDRPQLIIEYTVP